MPKVPNWWMDAIEGSEKNVWQHNGDQLHIIPKSSKLYLNKRTAKTKSITPRNLIV